MIFILNNKIKKKLFSDNLIDSFFLFSNKKQLESNSCKLLFVKKNRLYDRCFKEFTDKRILIGEKKYFYKPIHREFSSFYINDSLMFNEKPIIRLVCRSSVFLETLFSRNKFNSIFLINGLVFESKMYKLLKIEKEFLNSTFPYLMRWVPGSLTNLVHFSRCWAFIKKSHIFKISNPVKKFWLIRNQFGLRRLKKIPTVVVLFSTDRFFKSAIFESLKFQIPTISLVDSDNDCYFVNFPIRANDDSVLINILFLNCYLRSIIGGIFFMSKYEYDIERLNYLLGSFQKMSKIFYLNKRINSFKTLSKPQFINNANKTISLFKTFAIRYRMFVVFKRLAIVKKNKMINVCLLEKFKGINKIIKFLKKKQLFSFKNNLKKIFLILCFYKLNTDWCTGFNKQLFYGLEMAHTVCAIKKSRPILNLRLQIKNKKKNDYNTKI